MALEQHVVKSLPEYTMLLGLLAVNVVLNQPSPGTMTFLFGRMFGDNWFSDMLSIAYKWQYDAAQSFLVSRGVPPNHQPVPLDEKQETK
jgi:hypothetical protein